MSNRPDFIVDPSGNARDVRQSSNGQGKSYRSHSSAGVPPNVPRSAGLASYERPQKKNSSGVILVPIGLIITIIIAVARACAGEQEMPRQQTISFRSDELDYSFGNVYDYELDVGHRHLARGEYDAAIVAYNKILAIDPQSAEAYNGRGLVMFALGQYEEAIEEFDRTIELDPRGADGFNNRGITYLEQGAFDEAVTDLNKAIQLDGSFAKAYCNRGLAHYAQGELDFAISDFGRAIRLTEQASFDEAPDSLPLPGLELEDEAQDNYEQLFSKRADLPSAYAGRALAYFDMGDMQQASADLEQALQLGLDLDENEWAGWLSEWLLKKQEIDREEEFQPSL